MSETQSALLRQYAQGCRFFASLLLDLPNEDLIKKMFEADALADHTASNEGDTDDAKRGSALIESYLQSCKNREVQEVLQEVSVDRTRLFCGLTKKGPRPPYESLYRGATDNMMVLSVVTSYREGRCKVSDRIKNAPDHLGIELSFVSELCDREADALERGDIAAAEETHEALTAFMNSHLGCWAPRFGDEMISFATTDFYRGTAYLLKSFIDEGKELLSAA